MNGWILVESLIVSMILYDNIKSLKINIFMRLLREKKVLTKDQLVKRFWQGDNLCFFCSNYKDVNHLFILRHVAQVCGFEL
jgi:zinc-binding in reverse transcriptase